MFFVKKLISAFLMPMPVVIGLLGAGVALLWFTRRQRAGKVLVTIAGALLLLVSEHGVADLLIAPLEASYRPLFVAATPTDADRAAARARFIVVLGAGHLSDPRRPPTDQLEPTAARRLIEGLRLHRQVPGTKLVLSGYGAGDPVPHAEIAARAARVLGVPDGDLLLNPAPRDTEEEAVAIEATVGTAPFIVVTSASHLPRAVRLLRKLGLDPIPSPADFTSDGAPGVHVGPLLPSAGNVRRVEAALHEYLGTAWSGMRGRL